MDTNFERKQIDAGSNSWKLRHTLWTNRRWINRRVDSVELVSRDIISTTMTFDIDCDLLNEILIKQGHTESDRIVVPLLTMAEAPFLDVDLSMNGRPQSLLGSDDSARYAQSVLFYHYLSERNKPGNSYKGNILKAFEGASARTYEDFKNPGPQTTSEKFKSSADESISEEDLAEINAFYAELCDSSANIPGMRDLFRDHYILLARIDHISNGTSAVLKVTIRRPYTREYSKKIRIGSNKVIRYMHDELGNSLENRYHLRVKVPPEFTIVNVQKGQPPPSKEFEEKPSSRFTRLSGKYRSVVDSLSKSAMKRLNIQRVPESWNAIAAESRVSIHDLGDTNPTAEDDEKHSTNDLSTTEDSDQHPDAVVNEGDTPPEGHETTESTNRNSLVMSTGSATQNDLGKVSTVDSQDPIFATGIEVRLEPRFNVFYGKALIAIIVLLAFLLLSAFTKWDIFSFIIFMLSVGALFIALPHLHSLSGETDFTSSIFSRMRTLLVAAFLLSILAGSAYQFSLKENGDYEVATLTGNGIHSLNPGAKIVGCNSENPPSCTVISPENESSFIQFEPSIQSILVALLFIGAAVANFVYLYWILRAAYLSEQWRRLGNVRHSLIASNKET